jgi:nucleotide-binding universal stress UspA family protein
MFERIVVGTDGSASAGRAVEQAAALVRAGGGRLHVVSAYQAPGFMPDVAWTGMSAGVDTAALAKEIHCQAEALLDHVGRSVDLPGRVELHVREGDAADVLLNVADDVSADLIVVGNRGMSGGRRFLLGSVPNRVAHHATCNVLIASTT